MGDGRRVARVESEVLRLVAEYVTRHLREEIPGILTVSQVKMPADLRAARVYISILNHEGSYKPVLELLQKRAGEIQRHIADNMQARYVPKLTFFEDQMTDKVLKIEGILRDISGAVSVSVSDTDSVSVSVRSAVAGGPQSRKQTETETAAETDSDTETETDSASEEE